MNPKKSVFKTSLELLLLAGLVFGLAAVLRAFLGGTPGLPAGQAETVSPPPGEAAPTTLLVPSSNLTATLQAGLAYPLPEQALHDIQTATAAPYPTPMLDVTVVYAITTPLPTETARPTPTSTPTPLPLFPETPPILEGKAATLYQGDIWLVEPGRQAEALTTSGDVTAIFGWNQDGSKLLFRRGKTQYEYEGGASQLWLLDMNTQDTKQLIPSDEVRSASWSPVDDRVAYAEVGNEITIATLDGQILHQLKQVVWDFTWSPDGSAIAIGTYTPDMIDSDGLKYTVLGVWSLAEDKLQVFSDAKDEVHSRPVWSLDGKHILFRLDYYAPDKQDLTGLHILDLASGQVRRLEIKKPANALEISRSPRADLVAYRMEGNVYVTDFEGQSSLIGQGSGPLWLPDGKTLLYRAADASFKTFSIETHVAESATGGNQPSPGAFVNPEYYLSPGGIP
jgi:dipeptidyl aminopeptidase/acylaminoacyl peptidase